MKKQPPHGADRDILEPEVSAALAADLQPQSAPAGVKARIRQRLMDRVAGQRQFFVFANQGEWETVGPGIQIKLLQDNATSQSFLLHMAEQSVLPSHQHEAHEEAFVIEGEVWLDGVRCTQGDYHFAAAGTFHGELHTKKGCTLLMKTTAAS